MSVFNDILSQLLNISNKSAKNLNDELQAALECLDKFEEDIQNSRGGVKDNLLKDKTLMTTLQSISEDNDESPKNPHSAKTDDQPVENPKKRVSKKRSKEEVDDMFSPEQDKRAKRNASVKAQTIISKQVNVSLNQKMRRESSLEKKPRRRKEGDKENAEPLPVVQIKLEKISLPPEPMDTECLPLDIVLKEEPNKDENAMPPPAAPVPRPRRAQQKERESQKESERKEEDSENEETGRRSRRTRKQTDIMPPPPVPVASARSTRGSSRNTKMAEQEELPPPEPRPKRTRAKKKVSQSSAEAEKTITQAPETSAPGSPADNPRPKRTRRGRNAEKESQKQEEAQSVNQKEDLASQITPKKDSVSEFDSPVLQKPKKVKKAAKSKARKNQNVDESVQNLQLQQSTTSQTLDETDSTIATIKPALDETKVLSNGTAQCMNVTVTLNAMDRTMVLPNGVYNHAPHTPQNVRAANATVVLESRETMVLDKGNVNDATVVISKDRKPANVTEDNDSLLTDDCSEHEVSEESQTPPKPIPSAQPTSAVKEKVQKFEELAARTTRTKTRAMVKLEEDNTDNQTPPDKMLKPVLSQETLTKMNSMIFNGKPHSKQISSSASKPRAIPVPTKTTMPSSTSKLSSLNKLKEAAEKEKEDARKKKEAMLEAKRELQKKKREEKMANAAAAREAAERERKMAIEALANQRMEKQLHADQGKLERLKEVERKKLELARKVAETEERRKAEEAARLQRLAIEQKKAEDARKKQLEEAEAMKKDALVAKMIEKKQKEYLEKIKAKQAHTPLKNTGTPTYPQEPVYMADGFQYLNSDEDEEPVRRPHPAWSTFKARNLTLRVQSAVDQIHIDKLFGVRVHSPDLRCIFPDIERARLKRTSSAVWRTPPRLPAVTE